MPDYAERWPPWPDACRICAPVHRVWLASAAGKTQVAHSIPVVIGLIGPFLGHADVGSLLRRQLGQVHADLLQV